MKLTKSKLQQIIKEELGRVLGEEETAITAKPIEGRIGVKAFTNKALEIIKQTGDVDYNELEEWLFDNHDVDDNDWLSGVIMDALESKRLWKYYDEETHSFKS